MSDPGEHKMVQVTVDACGNKVMAKVPVRPPSHTGGVDADGEPTKASPHTHLGSRLGLSGR
jgi:hypothetical protein